jgi:hypothetical protein
MDLITRFCSVFFLVSAVAFSTSVQSAPLSSHSAGSPEAIHNIILELENVLYKLKDYARDLQAASSRRDSPPGAADARSEVDELQSAASKSQQAAGPVAAPKSRLPTVQQSDVEGNDISLREALEYLVSLAKQKKVEKRDHDIPFPLTDRDRK